MKRRAAIIGLAFLFALSGSDAFRADMGDRSAGVTPDGGVAPSRLGLHPPFRPRPSAPTGDSSRPGESPTTYDEPERAKAVTPAVAGKGLETSPGRITPSPSPIGKRPAATTKPDTASTLSGIASFMAPGYGARYLALPGGPGQRVTICGPAACVTRISTDAGPDKAMQRAGRIADLSFHDFAAVCGCDPWVVDSSEWRYRDETNDSRRSDALA